MSAQNVRSEKLTLGMNNKSVRDFIRLIVKYKFIYLLIAPGIIYFLIFSYVPMYGIVLAFKKFMYNKGIMGSPWVGFKNFEFVFRQSDFWVAFKNTIIISFGKLITGFPAPILFAILLNELRSKKFRSFIQSIIYMPYFFSWIIVFGIFFSLFSVSSGSVSKILIDIFGIHPPDLLGNPQYFRPIMYITDIWKNVGWGTIIYLAAIAGINPEMYESAIMDGANRFKQCIYITLPSLKYVISILIILQMGNVMQAGFDQIFTFYSAPTYVVGDIIDTFVYRMGVVGSRYEIGTAVGLFQSVINCVLLILANRIVKYFGEEGLF